eukprot:3180877-Rhodomonas_salina.1
MGHDPKGVLGDVQLVLMGTTPALQAKDTVLRNQTDQQPHAATLAPRSKEFTPSCTSAGLISPMWSSHVTGSGTGVCTAVPEAVDVTGSGTDVCTAVPEAVDVTRSGTAVGCSGTRSCVGYYQKWYCRSVRRYQKLCRMLPEVVLMFSVRRYQEAARSATPTSCA